MPDSLGLALSTTAGSYRIDRSMVREWKYPGSASRQQFELCDGLDYESEAATGRAVHLEAEQRCETLTLHGMQFLAISDVRVPARAGRSFKGE
jgi:hypothetical protein